MARQLRRKNKRDKGMSESELVAFLDAKIDNGIGSLGGEISIERQQLLDYYFGEKYGNERDGYSSVVTREVFETVEWIKPTLLNTFFGAHNAVEFEPAGSNPEDIIAARQQTEYCNHVFFKENNGFLEGYNWITDGLLQKVGIVKVMRTEETEIEHETYSNLTLMEMAQIDAQVKEMHPDAEVELLESEENENGTWDIRLEIKYTEEKTIVESIPSEEFINDNQHRSLKMQETKFCCHRQELHLSELVAMGYDEDLIRKNAGNDESLYYNEEKVNRNNKTDEQFSDENEKVDPKYLYEECYVRIDYDGDGFAELRQVNKIHNLVLENEMVDNIPFAALCSVPLAHKYTGMCVGDLVKDIQLINSTLMRMFLDGMYQSNDPRLLVDEDMVEVSDLLNPTSGGLVRGKKDGIMPIPTQAGQVVQNSLPAFQTLEEMKQWRTGVGKVGQGLDPDAIAKGTFGAVDLAISKSEERIQMIGRIFAETGFTDVFKLIRQIGIKHDASKNIKMGQQWVNVSPRSWKRQSNMTINVGLGTNSQEKQLAALNNVFAKQVQLMQGGFVQPTQLYNTLVEISRATGLKSPELYWTDPSTLPPAKPEKPQVDPNVQATLMNDLKIEMAKLSQKDRQQVAENLLKYVEMELKYDTDLEPTGIGEPRDDQRIGTDTRGDVSGDIGAASAVSQTASRQPLTE